MKRDNLMTFSLIKRLTDFLPSFRDIFLVAGIYVCFLCFGYSQENLYRATYHDPSHTFTFPVFLVSLLCLGNIIISGVVLYMEDFLKIISKVSPDPVDDIGCLHKLESPSKKKNSSSSLKSGSWSLLRFINLKNSNGFWFRYLWNIDSSVLSQTFLSSTTYVLSMLCTNYASSHVNYPTQILIKSAKTTPVILGGFIFFKKRYPLYDYIVVFTITTALIIYNFLNKTTTSPNQKTHQTSLGVFFLLLSLFCDSMTGPRQDQLLARVKITSTNLMFLTNVFAFFISFICSSIIEGFAPFIFIFNYPLIIYNILLFCISAGVGQLFIFASLTAFGSLRLALITTTRKFFTVILSVILFGHSICFSQWVCVFVIFSALAYQSYKTKQLKKRV